MLDKDGIEVGGDQVPPDATTPPGGGQTPAPKEEGLIKLTQEQFATRLERKGASAVTALMTELGITDPATLKESLATLATLQSEKLTVEERATQELATARSEVEQLRVRADAATAQALNYQLEAQAMQVMAKLEKPFADPSAALRLVDLAGVVKDGAVDADALTQVITAAAVQFPWALTAQTVKTPGSADNPGAPPTGGRTDAERREIYFRGAGGKDTGFFSGGGLVVPE